ncbi:MAG TPA: hypothetical protein VF747_02875, partial [Blastocatellia bacterium]
MIRRLSTFISLMAVMLTVTANSWAQREGFIPVEGASLKSKLDTATSQGRAKQSKFWAAYSFDVRPGVAIDVEYNDGRGNTTIVNGSSVSMNSRVETRNVGIFLLYEPSAGAIERIELYNLDRRREYS